MSKADDDDDDMLAAAGAVATAVGGAARDPTAHQQLVEHLPPANGTEDVFTLFKLYTVSSQLVRRCGGVG
jgi:hypothetical protein